MVLLAGQNPTQNDTPIVYARDGWRIPTEKPPKESEKLLKIRANELSKNRPRATLRTTHAESYPYNCVGLIFASRRAWIEIDYILEIFQHDGYQQIAKSDAMVGDVVLYVDYRNQPSHVAIITQINLIGGTLNIKVLSKWGRDAEFEHFEDDVPVMLGKPETYWTERIT